MFNLLRTMLICYCCFCCCSFGADFAFAFADDFEHFFFLHFTIKSEEKEEKTVLNILYLYIERYNCIMKNIKKKKKTRKWSCTWASFIFGTIVVAAVSFYFNNAMSFIECVTVW